MTDDEISITHSPLEQSITREGKSVQIQIYDDGEGGWLLEVVDEHGNSTCWDDPFDTDQAALDEALQTIDEDGIATLIGLTPKKTSSPKFTPQTFQDFLSGEELDELDSFLMSDATSDETMTLDELDGFLTAIVSSPVMLRPSRWLAKVWGQTERDEPVFETFAQAERITSLMMRHLNSIIWDLRVNTDTHEPIFDTVIYPDDKNEYVDAEMWAYGYMAGIELQRHEWKAFFDQQHSAEVLRPIYLLGADEVSEEKSDLTKTPAQRAELANQIPTSVAWIYRFWQPYRHAVAERTIAATFEREHPKVGRNDACPCGSGKKFKKCCGVSTVLH